MNQDRFNRVIREMEREGISQMVVTNPHSIHYLTGHYEEPYERFWAFYLNQDGRHSLIANRLFTLDEVFGTEILWYEDGQDGPELLNTCIDHTKPLGVDGGMAARFLLRLMELNAAFSYRLSSACMDRVRAHKDQEEQEKMRRASRINDAAMAEFKKLIRPGVTEREIAGRLQEIYQSLGGEKLSFSPSVAFGGNAACGHHEPDDTVLKKGDCVLLDVGCVADGYCSDMTRTFFFGEASPERRRVYETVLRAQEAAEAAVRPGVPLREIDKVARDVISQAGYGEYFTHRLGHFIGTEVHEKGDVSPSSDLVAEPGMIFSIEPGVYLPDDVGVRIEDLVLVTEEGAEILNFYPKELQIVEAE